MVKIKKVFLFSLLIFSIFVLTSCLENNYSFTTMPNGETIKVKLAISNKEQSEGLSNIERMENYEGMLFVRNKPEKVAFWMKDMKFSIDIIYLDESLKILEIFSNMKPCEMNLHCKSIFSESAQVKYVLELSSGDSEKFNLEVNSFIKLKNKK